MCCEGVKEMLRWNSRSSKLNLTGSISRSLMRMRMQGHTRASFQWGEREWLSPISVVDMEHSIHFVIHTQLLHAQMMGMKETQSAVNKKSTLPFKCTHLSTCHPVKVFFFFFLFFSSALQFSCFAICSVTSRPGVLILILLLLLEKHAATFYDTTFTNCCECFAIY